MTRLAIILVVLSSLFSVTAVAGQGMYLGGGYSLQDWTIETGVPEEPELQHDIGVFYGQFGYWLGDYASIETRLGVGGSGTTSWFDGEHELEVDSLVGVYIRGGYPLGGEFPIYPYVLVGYTELSFSEVLRAPGVRVSRDLEGSSLSYGVGGVFDVGRQLSVYGEYAFLASNDIENSGGATLEVSGISLGLTYNF